MTRPSPDVVADRATRSRGPATISRWVALVAVAIVGTEILAFLFALVMPTTVAVLAAVTVAAWLAGTIARVTGGRWWAFAWVVAFAGAAMVSAALLLVFESQVWDVLAP